MSAEARHLLLHVTVLPYLTGEMWTGHVGCITHRGLKSKYFIY